MESGAEQPITDQQIKVRQVTHFQVSWTEDAPGVPGTWTIQLVLDQGAEEYVIRSTPEDTEVLFELLERGEGVYFDLERKVLMFGSRPVE